MLKFDPFLLRLAKGGGGGGDTHTPVIVANAAALNALTGVTSGAIAYVTDQTKYYYNVGPGDWALANYTGFNATMPGHILPPQAEADNYFKFLTPGVVDLSDEDITFIDETLVANNLTFQSLLDGGITGLDLRGNAIPAENLLDIIAQPAGEIGYFITSGTLYMSGADMGSPATLTPHPAVYSMTLAEPISADFGTATLMVNGVPQAFTFGLNSGHDVQTGTDDEDGVVAFNAATVAYNFRIWLGFFAAGLGMEISGDDPTIILTTTETGTDASIAISVVSGVFSDLFPAGFPSEAIGTVEQVLDTNLVGLIGSGHWHGDYDEIDEEGTHSTVTF